jgi:ABC-type dipeptide/oligopeptide/nickel transport system ATPase component
MEVTNRILEIRNLRTYFRVPDGIVKGVDGVSFSLMEKETLGVVGESGCGKSVTALSIMGLIPQPHQRTTMALQRPTERGQTSKWDSSSSLSPVHS